MSKFTQSVTSKTVGQILDEFPIVSDFLENWNLRDLNRNRTFEEALSELPPGRLDASGFSIDSSRAHLCEFLENFAPSQKTTQLKEIQNIEIIGGRNKSGEPENIRLSIQKGEIVSIVGRTGAGKSRLLGDIECLAQEDTPTRRKILINGGVPTDEERFELSGKLVAQLSQNMNFVVDLSVRNFLLMHANSRFAEDPEDTARKCFECANDLSGERFSYETKVTQLSGGQSRSLMIADTAYMSPSPIILVDEIENAGIDRRRAVELLASREKIVLVSTHDPYLALSANRRIVIKNGGIANVIETNDAEKTSLVAIGRIDATLQDLRNKLRNGETIRFDNCIA